MLIVGTIDCRKCGEREEFNSKGATEITLFRLIGKQACMKRTILIIGFLISSIAQAQLSQDEKKTSLQELSDILLQKYVYKEVAEKIDRKLVSNLSKGKYDTINTGEEFAFKISQDLKEISSDLHLNFEYAPKQDSGAAENLQKTDHVKTILEASGYGIKEKKILAGNIGYLEVPLFGPLDQVADTLIAAMKFVADTDALIIDLRECRGSMDPRTIPFLSGYFFEEPVHLSNFYTRETDKITQFWSAVYVPGRKYLNKPVYILTSGRTFSGGEGFAFQMKNQERAQIIGTTTRGGAHPTEWIRLNDLFAATVPYATTIDPEDGSTWEGTGVKPHVEVKTQLALYKAHLLALDQLKNKAEGEAKHKLSDIYNEQKKNKPEFRTITFELKGYPDAKKVALVGSFNSWERESLLMQRSGDEWVLEAEVSPGKHTYMFVVDGKWINDPANPEKEQEGEYLNSVLRVK